MHDPSARVMAPSSQNIGLATMFKSDTYWFLLVFNPTQIALVDLNNQFHGQSARHNIRLI